MGGDAEGESIDVFEFLHDADFLFAHKVVESQAGYTEHSGFDGHRLAIADVECSESHDVVDVERVDMESILFELWFEFSFGGDIYLSVW